MEEKKSIQALFLELYSSLEAQSGYVNSNSNKPFITKESLDKIKHKWLSEQTIPPIKVSIPRKKGKK